MNYFILVLSYFIGAINFAYWIGRLLKVRIDKFGDENLGATNLYFALKSRRKKNPLFYYLLSAFLDISKTMILTYFFGPLAGAFSVIGHIFSVISFLFTGKIITGSGFASALGWLLIVNWKFLLLSLVLVFPPFYFMFKKFYSKERGHIILVFAVPLLGWIYTLFFNPTLEEIHGFLLIAVAMGLGNMWKLRIVLEKLGA